MIRVVPWGPCQNPALLLTIKPLLRCFLLVLSCENCSWDHNNAELHVLLLSSATWEWCNRNYTPVAANDWLFVCQSLHLGIWWHFWYILQAFRHPGLPLVTDMSVECLKCCGSCFLLTSCDTLRRSSRNELYSKWTIVSLLEFGLK